MFKRSLIILSLVCIPFIFTSLFTEAPWHMVFTPFYIAGIMLLICAGVGLTLFIIAFIMSFIEYGFTNTIKKLWW